MSSDASSEPVKLIEGRLYKCYTELLSLITSFEKGSTADITARLRSVEQNIQDLRETIKQIPDISSEEAYQFKKIRDLYRQIKQKDDLISTFGSDVVDSGAGKHFLLWFRRISATRQDGHLISLSEPAKNEKAIICEHCTSLVILPKVGVWSDVTVDLPLARQKKGVDTQKESVSGFWVIQDMMAFENVGFTHSVDGIKYLTCADCEFGPIGFVDNVSRHHLITPSRLKYKD